MDLSAATGSQEDKLSTCYNKTTANVRNEVKTKNGSFQGVTNVCKIFLFFISLLEI